MKKFISTIALTLAIMGCEKTDPNTPPNKKDELNNNNTPIPEIVLTDSEVEVAAEGASAEIGYRITNPKEGAQVTFETAAEWISELKATEQGKITFKVAANDSREPRQATVTVSYPEAKTKPSFTVKQAFIKDFVIATSDITTNSFVLNITPTDNGMDYFYHVIPSASVAELTDDDALYAYDVSFYEDMDASTGLGWQAWALDDLKKGAITDYKITSMKPDTEYLIYAYGVNGNLERITPIERHTIKTLEPVMLDVTFNIEILSEESQQTKVKITAENYDGYFIGKIFSNVKEDDNDETIIKKILDSWESEVQMSGWMGYTTEMILNMHASKNSAEPTKAVDPGQVCYAYAFAVDENAMCCSKNITIRKFTAK